MGVIAEELFGARLRSGSGGPHVIDQQDASVDGAGGSEPIPKVHEALRTVEPRLATAGCDPETLRYWKPYRSREGTRHQAREVETPLCSAGPRGRRGHEEREVTALDERRHTVGESLRDGDCERSSTRLLGGPDGVP